MNNNFLIAALGAALAACTALFAQSQLKSAVEFYDPAGTTVTSRFGWQGGAADGHFFIEIPGAPNSFKLQSGNLTLGGILTAAKFVGDGSGLTGTGPTTAEVAAVLTQDATFLASVKGGAGTGPTSAEVAAALVQNPTFIAQVKGEAGTGPSAAEVGGLLLQNPDFLASVKGKDGTNGTNGQDGTSPTADAVAAVLIATPAFTSSVKGKDGASPSADEVAVKLKADNGFMASVKGKDGASPSANEVAAKLKADDVFKASVKGEQGPPGTAPVMDAYAKKTDLSEYAKLSAPTFTGAVLFSKGSFVEMQSVDVIEEFQSWGTSFFNSGLTVTGGCSGCTAGGSDKRFKKNIESIESPLQKVQKINGVSFDWKKKEFPKKRFSGKKQIGVIAQDIVEVVPEVVSQDKDGYYLVDYSKLVPLLVEAIKEQQNQIKSATTEVALLKEKYEKQEKMIETILNEMSAKKRDVKNQKISMK